jgi:hypothetical protein
MKSPRKGTRTAVVASRPRSFRLSSVRVDLKTLFGRLAEAAAHAALVSVGSPESIAKFVGAALGSMEAFSIDTPAEMRAWRLVHGALARALAELTEELINAGRMPAEDLRQLCDAAELEIEDDNVVISREFFKNPAELPILGFVQTHFAYWLQVYGLTDIEAGAIVARLPSYYTFALHEEWRDGKDIYLPLLKTLDTPFVDAVLDEEDWERYRRYLSRQVDLPLFGETFGLRQIYVPLRTTYRLANQNRATAWRRVTDLDRHVTTWIKNATADDAICVYVVALAVANRAS